MLISKRLRTLRQAKNLSQSDIEKRSGLKRAYISRVENGHTVPSVETLEKMARALEVPIYQLFYEGTEPRELTQLRRRKVAGEPSRRSTEKETRVLEEFRRLFARMDESDRHLLLYMAQKMARR